MLRESAAFTGLVVLVAIALFVFLTVKGLGTIISAILCSALVSVFALNGFKDSFFNVFVGGVTSIFGSMFLMFSCGAVFGGVLVATGAGTVIGQTIVDKIGVTKSIYAIVIISLLFGYIGAAPYAFVPLLCMGIVESTNLPRYIAMVAVAGPASLTITSAPGALGASNVIASQVLGTTIYAGFGIGMIATVFGMVLLCFYIKHLINKARKNGECYEPMSNQVAVSERAKDDLPGFAASMIPIVLMLVFCPIAILGFHMDSLQAIIFCTAGGSVLLLLLNRKYVRGKLIEIIKDSVENIQSSIVSMVVVIGFASVVTNTAVYQYALEKIMNAQMNPYLLAMIGAIVIAALCADAIGSTSAACSTIGLSLIEQGADAGLIHRLITMSVTTLDSMPHGGSIIMALGMFGYTHKEGYKYLVMSNIVIPLVYTLLTYILIAFA